MQERSTFLFCINYFEIIIYGYFYPAGTKNLQDFLLVRLLPPPPRYLIAKGFLVMTQEERFVQHKRSNVVNKIPAAEQLRDGEIAVNYAKGSEALYIKNDYGEIVEISPKSKIMQNINRIIIKSDNSESSRQANVMAINDCINNLKSLGINTGTSFNIPVQIGDWFGNLTYRHFIEEVSFLVGTIYKIGGENYVKEIYINAFNGYYNEIITIYNDNDLETVHKDVVGAINEVNTKINDFETNNYYLSISDFSGSTITQDVFNTIVDVFNSKGKKHLYVTSTAVTASMTAEATVGTTALGGIYVVTWQFDTSLPSVNNVYLYTISKSSLAVTNKSYNSTKSFSGATTSNGGKSGIVPAPTTADTGSFLCGNGKWMKIETSSGSNIELYNILNSSGGSKVTSSDYETLRNAILNGQQLLIKYSDENNGISTYNCSASIQKLGTTGETLNIFCLDMISVSSWDPDKAQSSIATTYIGTQGQLYTIKKSDYSIELGAYIVNQPQLHSGYNIKKINGQDLLCDVLDGSGNLDVGVTCDSSMSDTSTNPVQNKVIKAYIDGLVGNVAAQLAEI